MAREYVVCRDAQEVSRRGADLLIEIAEARAAGGRRCSVALSGGSTPKTMFQMLAKEPYVSKVPWESLDLFWGDERCVPPDHKDSNYRMTREAMLESAPIPTENVYRISGENPDREQAAAEYQGTIQRYFNLGSGEFPHFDLIYLGMGDDGHTASLFPGTLALGEHQRIVTPNYVDKFGSWRITLTAPAINHGRCVAFLLAGEGKASRLKEVLEGPPDPIRLPSQMINPQGGRFLFIMDEAAAREITV